jgi:hypothetical protein
MASMPILALVPTSQLKSLHRLPSPCFTITLYGCREPPNNAFCQVLAFMGIIMIFSSVLFSAALHIHRHAVTSCKSPSRLSTVSLATSKIQKGTNFSFSFDSGGLPFVINNSSTCIIYNDRMQLVGDLRAERLLVETTHGSASNDYV